MAAKTTLVMNKSMPSNNHPLVCNKAIAHKKSVMNGSHACQPTPDAIH